jgi:hypothetical protein
MNEKFRLLALEAKMGTADFDAGSYYVATPAMMQQFCDDVCLMSVKQVEQYLKGNDLLKHFGVEQ